MRNVATVFAASILVISTLSSLATIQTMGEGFGGFRVVVKSGSHTFHAGMCTFNRGVSWLSWPFDPDIDLGPGEQTARTSSVDDDIDGLWGYPTYFSMAYEVDGVPRVVEIGPDPSFELDRWYTLPYSDAELLVTIVMGAYVDAPSEWWMYRHDTKHTGFSSEVMDQPNGSLWIYQTGGAVISSPAIAYGKVFVGSDDYKIYALDENTGSFIWSFQTGGKVRSSPIATKGTVYVGSEDGKIYALSQSDGTQLWSYQTGGWVYSSPVVCVRNGTGGPQPSDITLFVGSDDGYLYALDIASGTPSLKWRKSYGGGYWVRSSPAIWDDKVYVGWAGGTAQAGLYCLNISDGSIIWYGAAIDWVDSSPAIAHDMVFITDYSGNIQAYDAEDGTPIWEKDTSELAKLSSPAVAYGMVFACTGNSIYALNENTGNEVWSFSANAPIHDSSPSVCNGMVFVGSSDNYIYVLNAHTGGFLWKYQTGSYIRSSPGISNGKVVVGSDDARVYALAPQPSGPAVGKIKIGIIGPQDFAPVWYPAGMKAGAELAALEINSSGGVYLSSGPNGAGYYNISLVYGHEHAITGAGGTPEPDKAYNEMVRLCDPAQENCSVVIGGFRTECVVKLIQAAVEYETPFFINGASTSELVNATTQPYVWRMNPLNSSMLLKTIAGALAYYLIPYKLQPLFGCDLDGNATTPDQVRFAVLAEDLHWTQEIFYYLTTPGIYQLLLGPYANLSYASLIPAGTTDCSTYLNAVNASKARLLIHLFSGLTGIPLMAQFGAMQIKAMPVGINVMGQLQEHWLNTNGGCDYESILHSGLDVPIVPGVTEVFWHNFVGNYSAWPVYTAWGAYDGVYAIAEAFEAIGSTSKVQLKNYLEHPSYQRQNLNGIFKYTSNHDVYSNDMIDPYHVAPTWTSGIVRAFIVQWQVQWDGTSPTDGSMHVVVPNDQEYSEKWAIPPEMYPLVEDINYDGKVDMRDIGMAAKAFGSYPGHERWEKEADINFDNKVDMKDIGAIARKFGTAYPLPALPC